MSSNLKNTVSNLRRQLREKNETIQRQLNQLSHTEKEIQNFGGQNAELRGDVNNLEASNTNLTATNTQLCSEVKDKDVTIHAKVRHLSDAELKTKQVSEESSRNTDGVEKLRMRLSEMKKPFTKPQRQIEQKNDNIKQLAAENSAVKQEVLKTMQLR